VPYEYGSRGPAEADEFVQKYAGYQRTVSLFFFGIIDRRTDHKIVLPFPDWIVPLAHHVGRLPLILSCGSFVQGTRF
jgi:hypothetical protein